MKLTSQLIHSVATSGVGFNFHQLYVLGVKWPPKHGWVERLVGTEVSKETWDLVNELKGKRRNERRLILKNTRFSKELFMRKSDFRQRLKEIHDIIDLVEQRCLAADGPVTKTHDEITDEELREIYQLSDVVPSGFQW